MTTSLQIALPPESSARALREDEQDLVAVVRLDSQNSGLSPRRAPSPSRYLSPQEVALSVCQGGREDDLVGMWGEKWGDSVDKWREMGESVTKWKTRGQPGVQVGGQGRPCFQVQRLLRAVPSDEEVTDEDRSEGGGVGNGVRSGGRPFH